MIMTMVLTGMRVSELVNLKPNWIVVDDQRPHIYIQANEKPIKWSPKRDSIRKIPITNNLLKNLERHLGNRKRGYVFRSQKQKSTKWEDGKKITQRTFGHYDYRSIIRKINKISIEVLGRKTGCHIFRSTYASHLLKENVDLESIRKLLGHSDIKTTLIYIRSLPDFSSWDKVRNIELMNLNINLKI